MATKARGLSRAAGDVIRPEVGFYGGLGLEEPRFLHWPLEERAGRAPLCVRRLAARLLHRGGLHRRFRQRHGLAIQRTSASRTLFRRPCRRSLASQYVYRSVGLFPAISFFEYLNCVFWVDGYVVVFLRHVETWRCLQVRDFDVLYGVQVRDF